MQVGSAGFGALPRASWRARLPFFYGWAVLASLFCSLTLGCSGFYSFSVFFVALLDEFGWGRAVTAGAFSIFILLMGFFGFAAGAIIDRFGPSRVIPLGALVLACGLAALSRLTQWWEFYLYFGVVCALGTALLGWVPTVAVVSRWFHAKRGGAIGIASAGIGLSIVIMAPLSQMLISSFGWRNAYLILAAMTLLGIAPQAAVFLVGRPEEVGLRPDGAAPPRADPAPRLPQARAAVESRQTATPWTLRSAAGTARFWFLGGNLGLGVLTNQMLWVHQVAYLVDGGHDRMLAASITSLAGLMSMPWKILWGTASDRVGREWAITGGMVAMQLSLVVLVLAGWYPGPLLPLLFAPIFAAGYAVTGPVAPSAAADIFAGPRFGAIYGAMSVLVGFGGALGAWLAGFVFDVTGSYLAAFAVAAVSSVASAACMWLAAPRRARRPPKRQSNTLAGCGPADRRP